MTAEFAQSIWSANEAACVTGVPLMQVHRIIDADLLGDAVESHNGVRVVLGSGLIGLKFAHQMAHVLTREGRRRLILRLLDERAAERVQNEALSIDVRPMASDVRRGVAMLAKVKEMVETREGVLGGTPCFRGTRIPVHDLDAMLANGDSVAALQAAYPGLTETQIRAAPLYAAAYPRRGRRRNASPWKRKPPVSSPVVSFDALPPAS